MNDSDEKKCFVCVATGVTTEGELIEQHAPGVGIKGGMYLCETHSQEMKAKLAKSSKPGQSRRAEDAPQN